MICLTIASKEYKGHKTVFDALSTSETDDTRIVGNGVYMALEE
jgi:hypothetical protein